MRDGKLKWTANVGDVQSTPALMGDNIVVSSTSGIVYILNKFSGEEEWSYSPGYYLFNAPFTASPVVYGDDIYVSGGDGYMYALDNEMFHWLNQSTMFYLKLLVMIELLMEL